MKYWSFWCFWSIFILILTTMCNINTPIPVYQNQRSLLLGSSSTSSCTPGCASASGCSSGMGSSLWTHTASWSPLLDHDLQRMSEAVSSVCRVPGILRQPAGKAFLCLAAWRKTISMSYSLALLFGQPEMEEMESAVPLRKPDPNISSAEFKRSFWRALRSCFPAFCC